MSPRKKVKITRTILTGLSPSVQMLTEGKEKNRFHSFLVSTKSSMMLSSDNYCFFTTKRSESHSETIDQERFLHKTYYEGKMSYEKYIQCVYY